MPEILKFRVNGLEREVRAEPATPLLYILRNDLGLKGTRFGCGESDLNLPHRACYRAQQ